MSSATAVDTRLATVDSSAMLSISFLKDEPAMMRSYWGILSTRSTSFAGAGRPI